MMIKNINGTSDSTTTCRCGSWLKHWAIYSGTYALPNYCSVRGCTNKDIEGAHVQKANSEDEKWYICPLCKEHNHSKGTFEILSHVDLASANKKITCERSVKNLFW